MYCKACGKQIPEDSAYCSKCGVPQMGVISSATSTEYENCEIKAIVSKSNFWADNDWVFIADAVGPGGTRKVAQSPVFRELGAVPQGGGYYPMRSNKSENALNALIMNL